MKNDWILLQIVVSLVVLAPIWVRALGWWYALLSDNLDAISHFFKKKEFTLDEAIHSRGERARTKLANAVQSLRDEAVRLKSSERLLEEKVAQSEAGWHKLQDKNEELLEQIENFTAEANDLRDAREKAENELAHVVTEASREKEVLVERAEDAENDLDISRAKLAISEKERDELAESTEGIFNKNVTDEERMKAMDNLRRHPAVKRFLEV